LRRLNRRIFEGGIELPCECSTMSIFRSADFDFLIPLFQGAPPPATALCDLSGGKRDYGCDDTMTRESQRRREDHPCAVNRRILRMVLQILLIQNFVTFKAVAQIAECPSSEVIPGCPCYSFEDGLFLECAGATEETLRSTLQGVLSASGKRYLQSIVMKL
jgi:hypothetical protein